jgi:TPR repeat protein
MYFKGFGTDRDYTKALYYFGVSAYRNYTDAQRLIGLFYENGYGVTLDLTNAREWYAKAANQSDANASYNLGRIYQFGRGVEVNYQLAFQHYQAAARRRYDGAKLQLAYMYHRGLQVEKDSGKALELCESIRNKTGNLWNLFGVVYHSSDTQFQDFRKAFECYEQTDGGNKNHALRGIGLLYEHGDGVDKNYEKALEYYLLSQEEGNKGACCNIALLYYYGKGVSQDFFASVKYFERVLEGDCKEDNTYVVVEDGTESNSRSDQQKKNYSIVFENIIYGESHFYLGIMNEKGQGTSRDHEKALYHFKCSHSYGIDRANKFLENNKNRAISM